MPGSDEQPARDDARPASGASASRYRSQAAALPGRAAACSSSARAGTALSPTHFFSSTMMRCMTAICPAGPPKRAPRPAARPGTPRRSETPCAGSGSGTPFATVSLGHGFFSVTPPPGSNCAFRPAATAPGVERVVHHHAVLEHRMVVCEIRREPERQREQARRLRREFGPRRIGAAHDRRERRSSAGSSMP